MATEQTTAAQHANTSVVSRRKRDVACAPRHSVGLRGISPIDVATATRWCEQTPGESRVDLAFAVHVTPRPSAANVLPPRTPAIDAFTAPIQSAKFVRRRARDAASTW